MSFPSDERAVEIMAHTVFDFRHRRHQPPPSWSTTKRENPHLAKLYVDGQTAALAVLKPLLEGGTTEHDAVLAMAKASFLERCPGWDWDEACASMPLWSVTFLETAGAAFAGLKAEADR